jgi:hypothetical protein
MPNTDLHFIKWEKTWDLHDNPGADANELQIFEQKEHDSSHEVEDVSASNVTAEILNSSLQATGESPIKQQQL